MKKQQYANAVRSVEIRCKKTANAVPAVKEIKDSFAEFLCTFGAQYYYILKRIAEGNINLNDAKPLQYLAADLIAAFGFDLPDEDGAK